MRNGILKATVGAASLAMAASGFLVAPVMAATIASSNFTGSDQGWSVGEFSSVQPTVAATYDSAGRITTTDVSANVAFIAPSAYLGNQSAAFGGSISFDLFDTANDGLAYSPLTLIGNGLTLYYTLTAPPSTTSLTPFNLSLFGANFTTNNGFSPGGAVATDAQLQSVLASLDQFAILADWKSGEDLTTLDNVVFSDGRAVGGAVPEPTTWAMMLFGFGLVGAITRRRTTTRAAALA